MLQDMVHQPTEQIPIEEEISSPLNTQLFDFCESALFQETLQNSEVASNSNCCYDQEQHSSFNIQQLHHMNHQFPTSTNNNPSSIIPFKHDHNKNNNNNPETSPPPPPPPPPSSSTAAAAEINQSNLSLIFGSTNDLDNDIAFSIDFSNSTSFSIPPYLTTTTTTTTTTTDNNDLINSNNHQFDFSTQQFSTDPSSLLLHHHQQQQQQQQFMAPQLSLPTPSLPVVFDDECFPTLPSSSSSSSYMRHLTNTNTSNSTSCSSPSPLLDPTTTTNNNTIGSFLHSNLAAALTTTSPDINLAGAGGIFNGTTYNMFLGATATDHHHHHHHLLPSTTTNHHHHQELDFQGENIGIFCPEIMHRAAYSCPNELQGITNESHHQHLVNGGGGGANNNNNNNNNGNGNNNNNNSTNSSLTPEISSLEDPTFKVGKLTVEERREKIHRYMKKRNERNFSKKIKYACRKTLADSRPRVRGRFAKNDELEMVRNSCSISNPEEDTDDDVVVKEEDEMVESAAEIFTHISGVNSFKCNNHPLPSWG